MADKSCKPIFKAGGFRIYEFYISPHAYGRMLKRLGCDKKKVQKVARKAWDSKDKVPEALLKKKSDNVYERWDREGFIRDEYRYYMGFIFIFEVSINTVTKGEIKTLVTMYNMNHFDSEDPMDKILKKIKEDRVKSMLLKDTPMSRKKHARN